MKTYELLDSYIKERTSKINSFPDIVQKGIDTISGDIPYKLKLAITLAELITFSSHLRKPIILYDGTLVPTNAIVFALSASGTSKDKSLNTLRKSLDIGYTEIESGRKNFARSKAEERARLEGEGVHEWQKYYQEPKPLQAGLGTVEGLMHHFADIAENPMGAGSILTSEIGSELQSNGHMCDIIKTISVAYDLGNIPPKIVKSLDAQTKSIKNLPVNALFFGSQEAILFNSDIKAKFKMVFNTQLARRSIFTFTPELQPRLVIESIDQLYELKEAERKRVLEAQNTLNNLTSNLVQKTTQEPLKITSDAEKLFDVYLEYNAIKSDMMSAKFPISKLSRKHKQWLALKLAGTYAILAGHTVINEKTYSYAINTVESLSDSLNKFEKELVKEPYEQLADMCKYKAQDGEFFLSLHELRKLSYIIGTGSTKSKVEELTTLANSYHEDGSYTIVEGGIQYTEIVKTNIVGVSYIIFNNRNIKDKELKEYMKEHCSEGYEFFETNFTEIELLLKENAAYGSFKFKDGKRAKANIEGGTKFVVLDIDKSFITDEEVHTLLNDYNHYVVRTSDPNNEFRFRVILELDAIVDLEDQLWKNFMIEISEELGLTIDILPKSQIYFSFAHRNILSQLEGKTLKTKYLLEKAAERLREKPKRPASLPARERDLLLQDPSETFYYAFNAEVGGRSIAMYKALAHAIDLGADSNYIYSLAKEINEYWVEPMNEARLQNTLVIPALRRLQ